jgi:hypothetical protein
VLVELRSCFDMVSLLCDILSQYPRWDLRTPTDLLPDKGGGRWGSVSIRKWGKASNNCITVFHYVKMKLLELNP